MNKIYDPEGVELFKMFNVEINEKGHDLWHFRKVNRSGENVDIGRKKRTSEEHATAVKALAEFYAPYVEASAKNPKTDYPSPFDK
tara:strand:- start:1503 stop:1757 length:255 start_codon:yes stop_codon:yes gene_type:complete